MIQVELPVSKGDKETQTTGRPDDNDISGKYLISELKHTIDGLTASTGTELKLIRDVFTA